MTDGPNHDWPEDLLRPASAARRMPTLRVIAALMMREMAASSTRSWGGYLWAILEPAAGVMLLSIVFSFALRNPPIGHDFSLFYASGVVPFMAFQNIHSKVATSLSFSRPLLFYPAVTFFDALMARIVVAVLTELLVALVVFGFILSFRETRTTPDLAGIAIAYGMVIALGSGIGFLNAYLFPSFEIWQKLWQIVNRPLLIISCVIFVYDDLSKDIQAMLWWNPLVHIVGAVRRSVYSGYPAHYVSELYVYMISLVGVVLGLALLLRFNREILNNR